MKCNYKKHSEKMCHEQTTVTVDTSIGIIVSAGRESKGMINSLSEKAIKTLEQEDIAAKCAGIRVEQHMETTDGKAFIVRTHTWLYLFDRTELDYLSALPLYIRLHKKKFELCAEPPYGVVKMDYVYAQVVDRRCRVGQSKLQADRTFEVHHRNGCHYDNRMSNMEELQNSEHTRLHKSSPKTDLLLSKVFEDLLRNKYGKNYNKQFLTNLLNNLHWLCIHIKKYSDGISHRRIAIVVSDSIFEKDFNEMELEDVIREIKILDKGK